MLRHGPLRLLLVLLATLAGQLLLLAMLDIHSPSTPQLLVMGAFAAGVVALDLARTARRVLADFRQGRYDLALRGSRWLMRWTFRSSSRATLQLNLAACHLAAGDFGLGDQVLRAMDRDALPADLRPIWENNRAYHLLLTGGDPREALALCDEATSASPTNPAFRSTRGIALLSLGQVDNAIAELQTAVDAGLERQGVAAMAENYYHLAQAWESRGETAYARDHYLKSVNTGPETRFGQRSASHLRKQHNLWPA